MSKRYSPSGTIRVLYALGLVAWLLWMIRLPEACRDPGVWRCLFHAIGFSSPRFLQWSSASIAMPDDAPVCRLNR